MDISLAESGGRELMRQNPLISLSSNAPKYSLRDGEVFENKASANSKNILHYISIFMQVHHFAKYLNIIINNPLDIQLLSIDKYVKELCC